MNYRKRTAAVASVVLILLMGALTMAIPASGELSRADLYAPGQTVTISGSDKELLDTGACEVEIDGNEVNADCKTTGAQTCDGIVVDVVVDPCEPSPGSYSAEFLVPERAPGTAKVTICSDVCGDSAREYSSTLEVGAFLPSVLGMSLEKAMKELEGLTFVGALTEDSPKSGVVVKQAPKPGLLSRAGTTVDLELAGEDGPTVQASIKSQESAAESRVQPGSDASATVQPSVEAPLSTEPTVTAAVTGPSAPSNTIASGTSVATRSSAAETPGESAAQTVTETHAPATSSVPPTNEPQLVVVPPLLGLRRSEAESAVTAAGLEVKTDGDLDGSVIDQVPAAGVEIQRGSIVSVDFAATEPAVDQSYWYLPPLSVLATVAGFAGGAYAFRRLQRRPRRPRWLNQHVSLRADPRPASRDLETLRHNPGHGETGIHPSRHGIPQRNRLDHDDFDRDDADHVVALVGKRNDSNLFLEENLT